jgi:hypothetical protein
MTALIWQKYYDSSFNIRGMKQLFSIGPAATNHGTGRFEQDFEINPERSLFYVLKVHTDHLIKTGSASSVDLPQPGDSRPGFENPSPMP